MASVRLWVSFCTYLLLTSMLSATSLTILKSISLMSPSVFITCIFVAAIFIFKNIVFNLFSLLWVPGCYILYMSLYGISISAEYYVIICYSMFTFTAYFILHYFTYYIVILLRILLYLTFPALHCYFLCVLSSFSGFL